MVDLRPDLPSLSRVSYARELHGELSGAIDAMRRAIAAGNPASEGTSWARIHLGHLYLLAGDLDAADAAYQQTLAALPDYVHGLAGRARVAAARGDLEGAIRFYERAQGILPLPEYAIALGDAYRAAGNSAAAARQDELVRVIARLQRAAGVDVDLEMALWESDLAAAAGDAVALQAALATARAQYERRPESIHAADVLAWALFRAGQAEAALPHARAALRLDTPDPILLYHAGAIAAAAGQSEEAREYLGRALSPTPHFSLRYAPHARRLLTQLSPH
jgi:tetratricopeptide (TPR) repeat protein